MAERDSYARAVESFGALADAPLDAALTGPAALARASGMARSSGHRAATAAEAAGLLVRDRHGVYRRGPLALRIGLSASGFGAAAPVAEPILTELRQMTGRTAFLGVLHGAELAVGPYSLGRGAGYLRPAPRHAVFPLGSEEDVALHRLDGTAVSMSLVLASNAEAACALGILVPTAASALESAPVPALRLCAQRFPEF